MLTPEQMPNPEDIRATLTIVLTKDGQFMCNFPQDPFLAYGMLEMAKDQVREKMQRDQKARERKIAIAQTLPRNGG